MLANTDSHAHRLENCCRWAYRSVDGASLAVFRVVFGLAVACYAFKSLLNGIVGGVYVDPPLHFSYYGLEWIKPWPGMGMYVHFFALGFSGLLVAAGLAYRASSIAMALLFTFVFLCDRTGYLNHYYLMCLLCWLLVAIPADRVASLDRLESPSHECSAVPNWSLAIVRFHVAAPYFFGGIAKLNSDWLNGQPMRITLSQQNWVQSLSQTMDQERIVQLFSIGGTLFDLLVVPGLLWRRTRAIAFLLAVCFHVTNALVFPIGVFPWLMIGATTIFFAPDWPRRLWSRLAGTPALLPLERPLPGGQPSPLRQRLLVAVLCLACVAHCLIPLRQLWIQGNPSWTERGHFFAWHMMLRGKRAALRMYVTDRQRGLTYPADLRQYLTPFQFSKVARDPEHIRQLAHFIADRLDPQRTGRIEVRALALVSLNGRKPQLLIDPQTNLAKESPSWTHPEWIVDLTEPLLHDHWQVPLLEWEEALQIDCEQLLGLPPLDSPRQFALQSSPQLTATRRESPESSNSHDSLEDGIASQEGQPQ